MHFAREMRRAVCGAPLGAVQRRSEGAHIRAVGPRTARRAWAGMRLGGERSDPEAGPFPGLSVSMSGENQTPSLVLLLHIPPKSPKIPP